MSESLEDQVRAIAGRLGFDECRFAAAGEAAHAEEFQAWLDAGEHGDMAWMAKAPERRKDLAQLGFRAMLGGVIACCMTACIAGMIL